MNDGLTAAVAAHVEELAFLTPGELSPDAALFSAGVIDSLNLLDLVTFVEELCRLKVPAADLRLEHWDSVARIVAYVRARGHA